MPVTFASGTKSSKFDTVQELNIIKHQINITDVCELTDCINGLKEDIKINKDILENMSQELDNRNKEIADNFKVCEDNFNIVYSAINNMMNYDKIYINILRSKFMRFLNFFGCWYYVQKTENDEFIIYKDSWKGRFHRWFKRM